jgi:hypothetical protein
MGNLINLQLGYALMLKTANTPRTSTTTLAADPDLAISLSGSSTYRITARVIWSAPSAAGLKISWSGPSGATMGWSDGALDFYPLISSVDLWTGTGVQKSFMLYGLITTTNAGTLSLTWAQQVSNATATTVYGDSWLEAVTLLEP